MAKRDNKLSIFEIVWYSLTGGIAVWGLTFIILGVIARNLRSSEPLYQANESYSSVMGLGYLNWGMILLGIGVVLMIIVLLITAKKTDREVEKQQRRAERIAAASRQSGSEEVATPSEEIKDEQ